MPYLPVDPNIQASHKEKIPGLTSNRKTTEKQLKKALTKNPSPENYGQPNTSTRPQHNENGLVNMYLLEPGPEGDALRENLKRLLESDEASIALAFQMMKGGGVPKEIIPSALSAIAPRLLNDCKKEAKNRLKIIYPRDATAIIKELESMENIGLHTIFGPVAFGGQPPIEENLVRHTACQLFILSITDVGGSSDRFTYFPNLHFERLKNLTTLTIHNALYDGKSLLGAEGRKNLREFRADPDNLNGLPEGVKERKKLEKCIITGSEYVIGNRIYQLPEGAKERKNLKEIVLDLVKLQSLPSVSHREKLEKLSLPRNKLKEIPTDILSLKNLRYLELQGNVGLTTIPLLPNGLVYLNLEGNIGITKLQDLPQSLQLLKIIGTGISQEEKERIQSALPYCTIHFE